MIIFFTNYLECFLLHFPIQITMFFVFRYMQFYCLSVISVLDVFVDSSAIMIVEYGGYILKKLLPSKFSSFDRRKK